MESRQEHTKEHEHQPALDQEDYIYELDDVDPGLLAAMMAVLAEHPDSKDLSEEDHLRICAKAIGAGTFSDQDWLRQEILAMKSQQAMDRTKRFVELTIPGHLTVKTEQDMNVVVRNHKAWLDSVLNPNQEIVGGRAKLNGQTLSSLDLSGIDLRGGRFVGTTLTDVDFSGSDLTTADFSKAKFLRCNLSNAKFKKATLNHAQFEDCRVVGTDFRDALLLGIKWEDTIPKDCQFPDLFEAPKDESSEVS